MTLALAQSSPAPSPASDPAGWLTVTAAAGLLGRHPNHVARQCREELAARGQAAMAQPPEGGPARWYVHRSADARLAAGAAALAADAPPELAGFTDRQRRTALARLAAVRLLREARRSWPGRMADWTPRLLRECEARFGVRASRSRLYAWDRAYARPADVAKLVDDRGGDRRGDDAPAAWQAFRDFYLSDSRPSLKQCWDRVRELAAENGWKWCGLKSCHAQLDSRIPPEQQAYHREPAAWRQQLKPTIGQDPEAWRAGQCWVGDHKQLDLWCRFGGTLVRPWLTTWMDWRTRRVCGWVLSDGPNSSTILAALRHGLADPANHGGPAAVWIDNGKDYDAWVFHGQTKQQRRSRAAVAQDPAAVRGIFAALDIEPHFSQPYNPNGKARMERWFRTLDAFCRTFHTYAGDGPDTKPEGLAAALREPRMVPAFELVRDRVGRHIAGHNANADHARADLAEAGERLSPDEAMARWCDTRRVPADPAALDLLLQQWHRPVTMGRDGLTLTIAGRAVGYGQFEPALAPFKALRKEDRPPLLVSYDPHDLRTVRVHDAGWRFVCTAEMNKLGGLHGADAISTAHVAALNRQQADYRRAVRHTAELSLVHTLTTEERLADHAARSADERRRAAAPPPPVAGQAMRIVQTPLDGQSNAVAQDELRRAVGAEGAAAPSRRVPSAIDKAMRAAAARPTPAAAADRPRSFDPLAKLAALAAAEEARP